MLLTFIIFSIIFSFLLYIIEIYYKKSTSNIAIIKTISFLILSIILSFLLNHFTNPSNKYIPPKNNQENNEINNEINNEKNNEDYNKNFFKANEELFSNFTNYFKSI